MQYPVGAEDLRTVEDIVASVQHMRQRRPSLTLAIVKLNEGVSGAGNASLDLPGLPAPGADGEAEAIEERVRALVPEAEGLSVQAYLSAFEEGGGIVEERITGVALESPSVQMRALPDGGKHRRPPVGDRASSRPPRRVGSIRCRFRCGAR